MEIIGKHKYEYTALINLIALCLPDSCVRFYSATIELYYFRSLCLCNKYRNGASLTSLILNLLDFDYDLLEISDIKQAFDLTVIVIVDVPGRSGSLEDGTSYTKKLSIRRMYLHYRGRSGNSGCSPEGSGDSLKIP